MTEKKRGEEHGAMAPEIVFKSRLRALRRQYPLPPSKAREVGIKYHRFHRWLTEGIKCPNHHSLADVQKLAKLMGLEDWA